MMENSCWRLKSADYNVVGFRFFKEVNKVIVELIKCWICQEVHSLNMEDRGFEPLTF